MLDIYRFIDFDWFEELGEPSYDEDEYAPINYNKVCCGFYDCGSFFGGEYIELLIDEETRTYYMKSGVREPIGDYGWHTCWRWFESIESRYEDIKQAVDEVLNKAQQENTTSVEIAYSEGE